MSTKKKSAGSEAAESEVKNAEESTDESVTKSAEEKEAETDGEKEDSAEAGSEEENGETLVYVGPYIKGLVAHNTFFNNGLTPQLKEAADKNPAIANLIVPISKLAKASSNIANRKGADYEFYKKAENIKEVTQ